MENHVYASAGRLRTGVILSPQPGSRRSQLESQLPEKGTAAETGVWVQPSLLAAAHLCVLHSSSLLSQDASFILVPYLPISLQSALYITCCLSYLGWFLPSY